jgi:hypothetical protein
VCACVRVCVCMCVCVCVRACVRACVQERACGMARGRSTWAYVRACVRGRSMWTCARGCLIWQCCAHRVAPEIDIAIVAASSRPLTHINPNLQVAHSHSDSTAMLLTLIQNPTVKWLILTCTPTPTSKRSLPLVGRVRRGQSLHRSIMHCCFKLLLQQLV